MTALAARDAWAPPRPLVLAAMPGADPILLQALATALPQAGAEGRWPPAEPITPVAPLRAWLTGKGVRPRPATRRLPWPRRRWERSSAALPQGAVLIVPGLAAWGEPLATRLAGRPDVLAIAIVDRPIAWDYPEYAPPGVAPTLDGAPAALRRADAIVVVQDDATAERCEAAGIAPDRIVRAIRPSALAGTRASIPDRALGDAGYLVAWAAVEARGNVLLLLQLWRDLFARGCRVPRLLLAGRRGAQVEDIAPMLAWNDELRRHVVEAPNLAAHDLRTLIVHARAVLAPSFADGTGALLRDARMLGVPVIAADNAAYRAVLGEAVLSPIDGAGWRAAVLDVIGGDRVPIDPAAALPDWPGFIDGLVARAGRK